MSRLSVCRFVGHSKHFAADDSGATAIEYAIIAGGIAGAIIVTVAALGTKVTSLYDSVAAVLS
jgi:pilus assembly protein Flp/PilA